MARSEDFKTPLVRLAFANGLFKLIEDDWGNKNWTATLLIPKSEGLAVYEKAAVEAAKAEWGDKAVQMIKDKIIHSPFLDGDGPQGKSKKTGEPHAGFPGNWFLRVKSGEAYRPTLIDRQKLPIADQAKLKSGDYGFAVVHCFTWDNDKKGKGLTFGISMFQLVREGESLGGAGGVDVDKWAEVIPDEGAAPASTKGGAGAGGLFG
ncbi:ssDNA-binding protein [Bradyrhizobium liaoningense]|uniref:ssDNA-binding protein n=1 Tax=Bradyrhizobium liaoningense TaxID=43992 RepID=UPI0004BCE80A|nr:ssDNA-binding protein [Bradyrhizobium liaoningense]